MNPTLKTKLQSMLKGNQEIMSDAQLDSLQKELDTADSPVEILSLDNPRRVGILDAYICWIKF